MSIDYIARHMALMKRWAEKPLHRNHDFIEDGIIDLPRWQKAEKKILLLLKEAYGDYGDLCWLIREEWKGPKYKVWWTASYWLYAIHKLSGKGIPAFPKTEKEFGECVELLLSAAVINIKKSNGKTSSDQEGILRYAQADGDLLAEQISLISPDIIICGYTYDCFSEFWPDKIEKVGDTDLVFKTGNQIVINWWHSANQYPNELCFYALAAVITNAFQAVSK